MADQGLFGALLPMLVMFAFMYFLLLRPRQKEQSEHENRVRALKRGDEVILTSGIVGKIHSVEDQFLELDIANQTRIRVLKSAVSILSSELKKASVKAEVVNAQNATKA